MVSALPSATVVGVAWDASEGPSVALPEARAV